MSILKIAKEIAYHRDILRKYAQPRVKLAEIGGNQDVPFEQAFSNLAHVYLKDKAPGLLDYEVGFQLVDRNQENTKAIGIFGFKVGNQWLYAPVFFLNGDLKGHELLYIKSQDIFVPMKENWLNYILNRKPHILGESVTRNMSEAGVVPPNLSQLSRSPYKFASAIAKMPDWAQDALSAFANAVTQNPASDDKYKNLPSLPEFLKKEGRAVIKSLLKGCQDFPKMAEAINDFYGLDFIKEAIDEMKKTEKVSNSILCEAKHKEIETKPKSKSKSIIPYVEKDPMKNGQLKIAVYSGDVDKPDGDSFRSLSDKERSKLIQEGLFVTDKRNDVSIAYKMQTELKLTNPTETGIYEVLVKPGSWEKCLVILGPHYSHGKKNFATIIRLDGKKNWLNTHPSHIWVKSQMEREPYEDWYKELKDVKSLAIDAHYVIIGPNGQGTLPFTVDKMLGDEIGVKSYDVHFDNYADKPRPDHMPRHTPDPDVYDNSWRDGHRVTLTGRAGTAMKAHSGDVLVPDGFKLITISEPALEAKDKKKKKKDSMLYGCTPASGSSENPAIQPGNLQDIQLMIMEKTSAVKVYHSGTEVNINGRQLTPVQGLIHLIKDHGLREKQAKVIIKEAEQNKVSRFRIKYADEYYNLSKTAPSSPPFPEYPQGSDVMTAGQHPVQGEFEQNIPVPGMSASMTDRDIYRPQGPEPDYQTAQIAQNAAQSGQKEVFDTAMIGSLLKTTRDDSMVDKWLPDVMKGMDRIGRILMIFYWHQDEFADRYGKSDLPELEDGLRNSFEAVGDILLALRQKTIDPYPDEISKVDLAGVANM